MKPYTVTTPIYYVNDRPHIGHAYTTVAADAMARFHRLRGESVLFSVGVDENSQKNLQAMQKAGETDLQQYLDRMAGDWRSTWDRFGIAYDRFVRTTSEEHHRAVRRFWEAVQQSGDVYDGIYEGLYCIGCESFKTEADIAEDRCTLHPNKPLEHVRERNIFFRASAYRDQLLNHLDAHPEFIMPESRRNEVRRYIEDHFTDFSISREAKNLEVGIPVPGDETQRIYVWFDALINYLTVTGYGTDDERFRTFWPANLHLVGKDIIKFHCALWPAMIMSAAKQDALLRDNLGEPLLPRSVFAHGFFTVDGMKISKSLGNAVDPLQLAEQYGFDPVRYYVLRAIPFGEDGDFSAGRLEERYVHDLANTLGNLLNRSVAMSRKYFENAVPSSFSNEAAFTFADDHGVRELRSRVEQHISHIRFDLALETIWNGVDGKYGLIQANKFIEETQPFKLVKTDALAVGSILYSLLEYCRVVAWMIEPVMPDVAKRIILQLGQNPEVERTRGIDDLLSWGGLKPGTVLPEPTVLFPPLVPRT